MYFLKIRKKVFLLNHSPKYTNHCCIQYVIVNAVVNFSFMFIFIVVIFVVSFPVSFVFPYIFYTFFLCRTEHICKNANSSNTIIVAATLFFWLFTSINCCVLLKKSREGGLWQQRKIGARCDFMCFSLFSAVWLQPFFRQSKIVFIYLQLHSWR